MAGGSILGNSRTAQGGSQVPHCGRRLCRRPRRDPRLDGAAQVVFVRSPWPTEPFSRSTIDGALRHARRRSPSSPPGARARTGPVRRTTRRAAITLLASDKVRYVGEPVAVVVAETWQQAADAAEMVFADVDPLPDARRHGGRARLRHADLRCRRIQRRVRHDRARHAGELPGRGVLRRLRGHRHRPIPQPARRAVPARGPRHRPRPGSTDGSYEWISSQHAQGAKAAFVAANGVERRRRPPDHPRRRRRLRREDRHVTAEEMLLGPLSKLLGRPIRWRETRSESMMGLRPRPRPDCSTSRSAGRRTARSPTTRCTCSRTRARTSRWARSSRRSSPGRWRSGVYDIPNVEVRTTSVVTNTTPTTAYRGAGRPEATAAIERAMDMFAARDRQGRRRRPADEPHPQVLRAVHDGDRPGLRRRRLRRRPRQGARQPRDTPICAPSRRHAGASGDPTSSSASACASTSRSPEGSTRSRRTRSSR